MDVQTGMIILGEFALLGAVIWAYRHETALIRIEKHLGRQFRKALRRTLRNIETRRREKINKKALYTPMKPPEEHVGEKAA